MSVQKGDAVLLQIGGVTLGALVSNSQNMSADMLEKTNKDTPSVKQFDSGETGWGLSLESLFDPAATEGLSEALGYLKAGTVVTVLHGVPSGVYWSGSAYIASIDLSGPKNEISSYSLELQGTSIFSEGAGSYGAEFQAVYNAMTNKPSTVVAGYWNTMVEGLVADGVWADLDGFVVFASESNAGGEAALNWVDLTGNPTFGGSPVFTSLEGMLFSAGVYNSDHTPSDDASNMIQDDALLGFYSRTSAKDWDEIVQADGTHDLLIQIKANDDAEYSISRSSSDSTVDGFLGVDVDGLILLQRTGAAALAIYRNNVEILTDTSGSTGLCDAEIIVSPNNNVAMQLSILVWGKSLDNTKRQALQDRIETMMDANGKGVI